MSVETELKFRAPLRKLDALSGLRIAGAQTGEVTRGRLVSTYFDTPKQKLRRHHLTLRVRRSGEQYLQTIKAATAGSFARGEWETGLRNGKPDFHRIDDTPLAQLATKKTVRKIKPVFQTTVLRLTRPLHVGSSEIELAIERGKVSAGRHSQGVAEFELELKNGHVADLFQVARAVEHRVGAELELRSKAEHGYQLANGNRQLAVHTEPIALADEMTVREAFDVIAVASLRHFSANGDGVRALDAEAVHQMRVGLRRLRAAISLFDDILPGPSTARIKEGLKWLTNELAPAREMDVFVKEQIRPRARAAEPKRGFRAIDKHFSAQRRVAFQRARDALATSRYRSLLINVLEWLEQSRSSNSEEAGRPIGAFVKSLMKRRTRKVRKEGRRLTELSSRERHKLRIRVKKIRYAVEFFESLYPSRAHDALKQFSGRLKKIQNALGTLNDFVSHRALASNAALNASAKDRNASAFASGVLIGQEQEASRTLMKSASKEFRRLRPLHVAPS